MLFKIVLILTVLSLLVASVLMATTTPNSSATIQQPNQMPLAFTKNMGQWDDRVLFRANAGGATMWFTKEGVTYQFTRRIPSPPSPLPVGEGWSQTGEREAGHSSESWNPVIDASSLDSRFRGNDTERDSVEQLVLTAKFVDANPNPEIIAEGQTEYKCNYFLGNDPTKWHTDVPNYEAITLKDIYPGINLKYSGDGNGQAAYEFIAAPGTDIAQIKVAYEGAESTSLDTDSRLILRTKWGDMTAAMKSPVRSPRPLGEGSGVRAVLSGNTSCAWWTSSSTTSSDLAHGDVRQALAERSGTLTLSYSTYLGGGSLDAGFGIAVDGNGNAYVTGPTTSSDFPILNHYQTFRGSNDAFVTKLSSTGNSPIYSTYLGGAGFDVAYRITVDGDGNAYVTGYTNSSNFPTLNPYQATFQGGSWDVFVTKLSSAGNVLVYSTYLGGGSDDYGLGFAVDGGGNAYVTGYTVSFNFPIFNPYQSTFQGGCDVFVTKLSNSGASLIYSTYLGGASVDCGYGIAVDDSGNAFVTGTTESTNFPILNPYQGTNHGAGDVFVTKLSNSGDSLIYSTYLGGGNYEWGDCIAVDGSGNAYLVGETLSYNFPTVNPYQAYQGDYDVFVTKLSSSGNSLIYSTYLGGESVEYGQDIAVDGAGSVYVTGSTNSYSFPTLNPYQTLQGSYDAFVTKLSNTGNSLIYSTYLGGGSDDRGNRIAIDGGGNAYVTGQTLSSDFPTQNPYQTDRGGWDAFMTKLSWTPEYPCGDVNTDEQVNLLDAVFLINYIFVGGPAPQLLSLADVDCSGSINIADVVLLINYIFRAGPAPCTECE